MKKYPRQLLEKVYTEEDHKKQGKSRSYSDTIDLYHDLTEEEFAAHLGNSVYDRLLKIYNARHKKLKRILK